MGLNTLEIAYANGDIIDAAHINELTAALLGSFVGRDTAGVPATNRSLGTLAIPWGTLYASGIVLNGVAIDTSQIVTSPNRVVSGKTRSLSSMPDFIRPDGTALEFDILGLTDNLVLSINNTAVTVNTDITKTGFTAAPSSNNTCLVNDAAISNDKYIGEDNTTLTIGTVGTEISSRVGQICAFSNGTEILLAYVNSATTLTQVRRGYMFDSSGNPKVRANLSHTNALTILSLGWVFIEDNGTTVDVSYKSPHYGYSAPGTPATGDYWYDLGVGVWKRYSGASFDIIDRTLVGMVAANTTACIGARCIDFDNNFQSYNNLELEIFSTEVIRTKATASSISVYGTKVEVLTNKHLWNITTDLETGLVEANSTVYYLYISDEGQKIIATEKPHWRPELRGDYHPYHSWRMVGMAYNDGSGNLTIVWGEQNDNFWESGSSGVFTTTSTSDTLVTNQTVNFLSRGREKVRVQAAAFDASDQAFFGANRAASTLADGYPTGFLDTVKIFEMRVLIGGASGSVNTMYGPGAYAMEFLPKVGFHTFEMKTRTSSGPTTTVSTMKTQVRELKNETF